MSNLLIELREMADAYLVTHQWDERDAETCANAATEIESLRAKVKYLEADSVRWKNSFERTAENTKLLLEQLSAEQSKVKVLTDALEKIVHCTSRRQAEILAIEALSDIEED